MQIGVLMQAAGCGSPAVHFFSSSSTATAQWVLVAAPIPMEIIYGSISLPDIPLACNVMLMMLLIIVLYQVTY